MERFKRCNVKLDENKVIRLTCFHYGSVSAYCIREKISRARFYQIVTWPHLSEDEESLQKLARNLKVNIKEILM